MSPILFWSLLLVTCGVAFTRGDRYERLAAFVCLSGSVVTLLSHTLFDVHYAVVEGGDMLIDLAVLGAFVVIALQSERFWPLWVAGLQLTSTFAHLLKAIEPDLIPQAYAAAARFWSYPILLIIIVGAWRSQQRRAAESTTQAT